MASQPSPSPAAKGKKPMAYPQHSQQVVQSQQQQQQQPRSERAASKAPLGYQAPTTAQNRQSSPPSSNTSKSRNTTLVNQKGKANANKIWSTSTTEERERIKEFWLGLSEEERRDLVKIEKDTVLKKMKEQQKHSCSCAVCGRKRFVSLPLLPVSSPLFFPDAQLTFFSPSTFIVCVTSDMFAFLGFPAPTAILSLDQYLIDL